MRGTVFMFQGGNFKSVKLFFFFNANTKIAHLFSNKAQSFRLPYSQFQNVAEKIPHQCTKQSKVSVRRTAVHILLEKLQ